jgi:regulator of protease activity HflC (stomatin/prohibitin superfamily)
MFITLAVLCALALGGIYTWRSVHIASVEKKALVAASETNRDGTPKYTPEQLTQFKEASAFPLPGFIPLVVVLALVTFTGLGTFNKIFFYAEPGYVYHVRTIAGEERVINTVGYSYHMFGRVNAWKKAMTVQATSIGGSLTSGESDELNTSANLGPQNVIFLDQVDADVTATARFLIPTDREAFLTMAQLYRSPANLLRTSLIPSFRETLQATGSLMSAEEYFSGSRTEFNREFENQLSDGIYIVKREEVLVTSLVAGRRASSANAAKGTEQDDFGQDQKVVFKVQKQLGADGLPRRKTQGYADYGITLVDAKVTDVVPNIKFKDRMGLKQEASANRAIARETRIQEEQEKLLAIARGERKVAEEQALAKMEQIKLTTDALTQKQLVVTNANKLRDKARIDMERSGILLDKAKIDAEAVVVAADALAYEKRVIIAADNALTQKLQTEERIQKVWADAYAKRAVPQYVFGGNGETPVGGDQETARFMKLMTIDAAKRLAYDRGIPAIAPAK